MEQFNTLLNKVYLFPKSRSLFLKSPVKKITLSLHFYTEPTFKDFAASYAALKLISNQTPYVIRSKKSRVNLKVRKGSPLGVKVTLRGKNLQIFLTRLVWEILPNIKGVELVPGRLIQSFFLKDIFIFSELKKFYFFFNRLPQIKIVLTLDKNFLATKEKKALAMHLLQIPF